jgi:hypothetical protein
MAAELNDMNVPINCAECNVVEEGIPAMIMHIKTAHPDYTPEQAVEYAKIWAEDAYESIEAIDTMRAEEFRRTGIDPYDLPSDRDPL